MSKIQDNTIYYRVLRFLVRIPYTRYFRQIEVRGADRIPYGEPVIFAANHQNALMDALAILFFQKNPIVFMARADMFQNKFAAGFLRSLKIAPIYRIRDGFENLAKNEKQMNGAVDVLLDRKQMCLMPEGNQGKQRKLRPLVKGIFRIAYAAEERLNGEAHVKIIPVGIDYNYYKHAGADLVVSYGEPIEVKDYIGTYKDNQANGLNALREKLAESISALMHDIKSTSDYDKIYRLCCFGTPAYLEFLQERKISTVASTVAGLRFDARRALGKILDKMDAKYPERIDALDALCVRLKKLPGSPAEVTEWMEEEKGYFAHPWLGIVSIPFIPGMSMNFLTWLINRKVCEGIEDEQMHSTFAFTLGMLLNFLVYFVVTCCVVSATGASTLCGLMIFFAILIYGLVSERIRQALRLPFRRILFAFGKRKRLVKECKVDFLKLKNEIRKCL